jgi:hypothetical protein
LRLRYRGAINVEKVYTLYRYLSPFFPSSVCMSPGMLPTYSDGKQPLSSDMAEQDTDKQFDGLRVGQPSTASRLRERWQQLGRVKKGLIAALAFLALLHLVTRFSKLAKHDHKRHHWKHPSVALTTYYDEDWNPELPSWEPENVSAESPTLLADTQALMSDG